MADALLPPLPSTIQRAIRNPVALTTKDMAQSLRSGRPLSPSDHATVLDRHQDYLDALSLDQGYIFDYLTQLAAVATPASSGQVTILEYTLVAAVTTTLTPTAPTATGDLHVFVKAKGPTALLAWGATTKWGPTEFDSTTNTWTVFNFTSRSDPADSIVKWFYTGPNPVTGQA